MTVTTRDTAREPRRDSPRRTDLGLAPLQAALDEAGAAWVLADRPGRHVPLHVTGGWSYVRFHQGRPGSAWSPREKLRRWADRLAASPAEEVFVYFNNDAEGAAAVDARTFTTMLAARGVEVSLPESSDEAGDLR